MKKAASILIAAISLLIADRTSFSQDESDYSAMYRSWALFQIVPSPVIFQDADEENARVQLGFRWQIIPLNISFRSNKYTTPLQFFKINPVRRFSGSMDIFVQPEWVLSGSKYSGLARFSIAAGSRVIFPVKGDGEKISVSLGGKYTHREDLRKNNNGYWGLEAGAYAIFGFLGVQFNYNFDERSRYSIGFYFKYF